MTGMHNLFIKLAVAVSAATFAAGLPAQSFPSPPNWGFGYEHYGQVRELILRMNHVQGLIHQIDHRHQITGRSTERLIEEGNAIQRHLRNDAALGLDAHQAEEMLRRVIRIEQKVKAAYAERDRRLGTPYAYPSEDWRRDADQDSDRNDRDDRWEDDYRVDSAVEPR